MIDPDDFDDDEWGEGTGSPIDKVVSFLVGAVALYFLIVLSYLLTR